MRDLQNLAEFLKKLERKEFNELLDKVVKKV